MPDIELAYPCTPEIFNQERQMRFVVIPGWGGSGKDLSWIRSMLGKNTLVPSSVGASEGFQRKDFLGGKRYKVLAEEAISQGTYDDLVFLGHSWGGPEMLELANEVLDNPAWKGNSIDLNFFVTPFLGVKEKGKLKFKNVIDALFRLALLPSNFSYFDQDYFYPFPDLYHNRKTKKPDGVEIVADSKDNRAHRRELFEDIVKNHPEVISQVGNSREIVEEIQNIDNDIIFIDNPKLEEKKLRRRAKLLEYATVFYLAMGKQFTPDEHQPYLAQYRETEDNLSKNIVKSGKNALIYYSRAIKMIIHTGIAKVVKDIVSKAEERGVKVNVNMIRLQGDSVLNERDVEIFRANLQDEGVADVVIGELWAESFGHTAFGYTDEVYRILQRLYPDDWPKEKYEGTAFELT